MFDLSNWQGRALSDALNEQPSLELSCYSYGWLLTRRTGAEVTQFAVDPAQIAQALAAKITFDTGLIDPDTLLVRQDGPQRTVVGYRPGRKTGIYLEGSETPLRVPLPPLVMIRTSSGYASPTYRVYALKRRPETPDVALFHAPLPNVFNSGNICWGTVPLADSLAPGSLSADWDSFLGSRFGDHACSGKSRSHRADIRQKLIALDADNARRYPTSDLIAANKTLAEVLP